MTCRTDRRIRNYMAKALAPESVYNPVYAARLREHRLATPHDRGGFPRGANDRRVLPDSVPAATPSAAGTVRPDWVGRRPSLGRDSWRPLVWLLIIVTMAGTGLLFFEFAFKPLISLLIEFGDWAGITAPH